MNFQQNSIDCLRFLIGGLGGSVSEAVRIDLSSLPSSDIVVPNLQNIYFTFDNLNSDMILRLTINGFNLLESDFYKLLDIGRALGGSLIKLNL